MNASENIPAASSHIDLSPDDVEDGHLRLDYTNCGLDDKELLHFIERYVLNEGFYDYYNQILPNIFEHPNMKTNVLWVENPTTGSFAPLNKRTAGTENFLTKNGRSQSEVVEKEEQQLENAPLIPQFSLLEGNLEESDKTLLVPPTPLYSASQTDPKMDEWTMIRMEYYNFHFLKRLLFLFFQGVLAGFCFTTFYVQISSNNNLTQFLNNYQPIAQEIRRFYYLISSIAVLGSLDYVKTIWSSHSSSNPFAENLSKDIASKLEDYQKTSLFIGIIVLVLHIIAFVVSVIISFYDVQILLQFNYQSSFQSAPDSADFTTTWAAYALNDAEYRANINEWITADRVRIATGLLAWIGCCILLWRDVSRYQKIWLNLRRLRTTALAWMNRAQLLEGSAELEKLSNLELRELINSLEVGLQRARNSLTVLERDG